MKSCTLRREDKRAITGKTVIFPREPTSGLVAQPRYKAVDTWLSSEKWRWFRGCWLHWRVRDLDVLSSVRN